MTSDCIYHEAVTLTDANGATDSGLEIGRRIRGDGYPSAIDLLHSSPTLFDDAVSIQHTYADPELSFTDAMTVAMVEHHDIDGVLSFDDDFDEIVTRFDPQTLSSR